MEKWVIEVIAGYIIYMSFIVLVTANTNITIYDLTDEQVAALSSQDSDILTLLNKFLILSTVSSAYGAAAIITGILTIIFIIAVGVAINEFIPFT